MIRTKLFFFLLGYVLLLQSNAQQWSIVFQNLNSTQRFETIDAASHDTLLFSGPFAATGINYNRAATADWYTVPTAWGFRKMSFIPGTKTGYGAAAVDKGLMKTVDGGKTWSLLSRPSVTAMNSVFAVNENNVFFGGSGEVWRSVNGTTFTVAPVSQDFVALADDIFFVNQNTGYMITSDFDIRKTTNGGNTWTVVSSIVNISKRIFFTSETVGYIAGSGGIYKTTDGAQSWLKVYTAKNIEFFRGISFFDADNGVAVSDAGKIIYTHDAGISWSHSNSGTTVDLYGVYMLSATSALACGDKFTVIQSNNIDQTVVTALNENTADAFISIYPNPVQEKCIINYSGVIKDQLKADIYNSIGEKIISIALTEKQTAIDVEGLLSGVYNCIITEQGNILANEKIVIL